MLNNFTSYITYDLIKLDQGSQAGDVLNFFIYETIKIFLLLTVIISNISIIRSYFPLQRPHQYLPIKNNLYEIYTIVLVTGH